MWKCEVRRRLLLTGVMKGWERASALIPATTDDAEDVEEEINEVEIEGDGGNAKLFRVKPFGKQVGIKDNVAHKDEGTKQSKGKFRAGTEWHEDLHKRQSQQ